MATQVQILHKTTKQNIYRYQACWDVSNFGTFFPKPVVLHNGPDKQNFSASAPPAGLYPELTSDDEEGNANANANNKLSNVSLARPATEKLCNKMIGFSSLNIGDAPATPATAFSPPEGCGRLPVILTSPEFKFKVQKTPDFIEAGLKLTVEKHEDTSGDYKLLLEATVLWPTTQFNQSWDGQIQIDIINADGEVLATPASSIMTPAAGDPYGEVYHNKPPMPAFQEKIQISESLAYIWTQRPSYFSDNVFRIRLNLTLFGKVFNEEEPLVDGVTPSSSVVDRYNKDMLTLLESGGGADVVLVCAAGKSKFDAHSVILSSRSPALGKMIQSAAKANKGDQNEDKIVIQFAEVEPCVLRSVLRYIYATEFKTPSNMGRMLWICSMLKAADKFELEEMKALCYDSIRSSLTLAKCGLIAVKAAEHGADGKSKKIISDYCTKNWGKLTENPEFVELIKENPEVFAAQTMASALKATEAANKLKKINAMAPKQKDHKKNGFPGLFRGFQF